jgi:succinyldiaminopimelate transaminase
MDVENTLGNSWLDALPAYSLLRNDMRKTQLKKSGVDVFDFGLGDPQEETPFFIREALARGISAVSQYPTSTGSVEFRQSCANWVQRRFQTQIDPAAQVISSNGSKEAVFHIPHVLLNCASQRRMMVFPDPGYPVYKSSTLLSGGIPFEVSLRPEKNFVFDPSDIPEQILPQVAALWVCYPHNPTGAMMSRSKMESLYAWALKHNIVLLADECYVDMYFPGTPPPDSFLSVAQSFDFKNLLCFFSLSKRSGMTGYRSGFVAGDRDLIGKFAKYRPNAGLSTPEFIQKAAIAAWNDDVHARERNAIFAEKRRTVDLFFQKNGIEFLPSTATFYVWAKVPSRFKNGEEFAEKLASATGIVVTPGDALGATCDDWFRLALVPTVDRIEKCLAIWQQKIDQGDL